jgi:hypothetical protein
MTLACAPIPISRWATGRSRTKIASSSARSIGIGVRVGRRGTATSEARGRGVAGGMTTTLLQQAKTLDCTRAVLHSTDMAVGVYSRAGFVHRCDLTVYATAALWSDEH